jgi:Holliday junction resolvase RusA-like endonuclease
MYQRIIDMPQMKYHVPGTPTPLQRPRYGNGPRPFDAQKQQKLEFKHYIEALHGNLPFYTTPVALYAFFFFMVPKTSATRAEEMNGTPHTLRPDASNLLKYVEDCCEGILYRDDSIVYLAFALKFWSDMPRTEFTITPIDACEKVFPHAYYDL